MPLLVWCDAGGEVKKHIIQEINQYDCAVATSKLYNHLVSSSLVGPSAVVPPDDLVSNLYKIKHRAAKANRLKDDRSATALSSENGKTHKAAVKQILMFADLFVYSTEHHYGFGRAGNVPKWDIVAECKVLDILLLIEAKFQGGQGSADAKWQIALDDCRQMLRWTRLYEEARKRFSDLMID